MLRTNTSADSPYYAVFVTPNAGLTVQYRTIQGLNAQIITQNKAFTVPTYLRVARWNNIFTTYVSPDGVAWTPLNGSSATIRFYRDKTGGSDYEVVDKRGPLLIIRQPSPWSLTSGPLERLVDAFSSLLPGR